MAESHGTVRYFVDTWFWCAFTSERDSHHREAVAIAQKLKGSTLVTSQMVLTEFLNMFSDKGDYWRRKASLMVATISKNKSIIVFEQSGKQFVDSVGFYAKHDDKQWSLTDCSSFIAMRDEGITVAITNDKHFEQASFTKFVVSEA